MTVELTTLPNGIRVASHHFPHVETVSLGVFVGTGARHETVAQQGISHVLEHMAFKGTARRSARAIAEEIETVGGDLNAATSLETTAYYARVLKGDHPVALEVLADIVQNPRFASDDLEKEREVILQEIAGIADSPDDIAYDLIHDAAWPDQPAGRPIIGTVASVSAVTSEDLKLFLAERYVGPSIVISAAGAIHHDDLVRHAGALFGGLSGRPNGAGAPAAYRGGRRVSTKPFEQSHLVLGFESPPYGDPEFFAAQVFSGLLGGGMSSRLFQEVRENRGLCYAIYSSAFGLSDSGMMVVHAATGNEMMAELTRLVAAELGRAATTVPDAGEVERSKAQIKAGLLMSLESTGARAEQMARQLLLARRIVPPAELAARIDAVDAAAVATVARRILTGSLPSVAVVGAGKRSAGFAEAAAQALAVG
jgi:predicted Zn-dependent peptidase